MARGHPPAKLEIWGLSQVLRLQIAQSRSYQSIYTLSSNVFFCVLTWSHGVIADNLTNSGVLVVAHFSSLS